MRSVELRDKTVWITGASSGIGRELALLLANAGARLILSARNADKLDEVAAACRQKGAACDVLVFDLSRSAEVTRAAEKASRISHIDILINNGGISQRAVAMQTKTEVDRLLMEVNYFAPVRLAKLLLPAMLESGEGQIVCISSIIGKFGFPGRTAYSASKHALHGFFDSLRAELNSSGIYITLICPGRIKTDISLHAMTGEGNPFGRPDRLQTKGMPARKCAEKILEAIRKNKKEAWIGGRELTLVYFRNWFPALYRSVIKRYGKSR